MPEAFGKKSDFCQDCLLMITLPLMFHPCENLECKCPCKKVKEEKKKQKRLIEFTEG